MPSFPAPIAQETTSELEKRTGEDSRDEIEEEFQRKLVCF
jgi:hypothetical protein